MNNKYATTKKNKGKMTNTFSHELQIENRCY